MSLKFTTKGYSETEALGAKLAETLEPGDVVALTGDLGGGKTTFTRGLAKGLGVKEPVTSPTFLLERVFALPESHPASTLHHFDAYRLEGGDDLKGLGWEELMDRGESIVVVEWADRVADAFPENSIWVKFDFKDDSTREITIENSRLSKSNIV